MKRILGFLITVSAVIGLYYYHENISKYIIDNFIYKKEIKIPESNEYKRDYDFLLVENTDNFYPTDKQDLYNIFYTILNNGYNEFTFYCDDSYSECLNDVKELTSSDNEVLATINNFVHPYNSYSSISINMNNLGRIHVAINKLYSNEDIIKINNEVNKIYSSLIKDNMTEAQKIKAVHDYIINNTVYDKTWINENNRVGKSNTAYGPLFNKKALCGGYTDLMELFLEKFNIKSYKIASSNHIWNYVYINNEWKHLDLTWDDPVTNTGKNLLEYNYYLLDTNSLLSKKDNEHNYNKNLYLEAK